MAHWTIMSSPGTSSYSVLEGVSADSSSDAWAVGYDTVGSTTQVLIEHYTGSSWTIVSGANPGTSNLLFGVAAISPTNVWAVGTMSVSSGPPERSLIEHYDGVSWSVVPSPAVSSAEEVLTAISAVSPTDIWAVGDYDASAHAVQTLVEHYNGTSWTVVPSPNSSATDPFGDKTSILSGVKALSSTNVWAVGYSMTSNDREVSLIEHYNGTSWSIVPSPNLGTYFNSLRGVSDTSASDVWAVGSFSSNGDGSGSQMLILHWDGSSWKSIATPNLGTAEMFLYGVVAISSSNAWAVGSFIYPYVGEGSQTLTVHWNGSTWDIVPGPTTTALPGGVAMAVIAAGPPIAVGSYSDSSLKTQQPMAMQWTSGGSGPAVTIGATGTDGTGHIYVNVAIQDPTGLLTISGTKAINCTLAITQVNGSPFGPQNITPAGTAAGLYGWTSANPTSAQVTITKVNNSSSCVASLTASNVNHDVSMLDPVMTPVTVSPGTPVTQTTEIDQSEHWVTIRNMTPGLNQVTFVVNGTVFVVQRLQDGEQRTLDLGTALHTGANTVRMVYLGRLGASAAIIFSS